MHQKQCTAHSGKKRPAASIWKNWVLFWNLRNNKTQGQTYAASKTATCENWQSNMPKNCRSQHPLPFFSMHSIIFEYVCDDQNLWNSALPQPATLKNIWMVVNTCRMVYVQVCKLGFKSTNGGNLGEALKAAWHYILILTCTAVG